MNIPLGAVVEIVDTPESLKDCKGKIAIVRSKQLNADKTLLYLVMLKDRPAFGWWAARFMFKMLEDA